MVKIPWSSAPVVRLILPFIAGILCSVYLNSASPATVVIISFILVFSLVLLSLKAANSKFYKALFFLSALAAGYCAAVFNNVTLKNNYFGKFLEENSILRIRITEPLEEKQKTFKATAEVIHVINNSAVKKTTGKFLLYLPKSNETKALKYGDIILISNKLSLIDPPKSPGVFDYARHMAFRNIYYQAFLKTGQYEITGQNQSNYIWKYVFNIKQNLLSKLDEYIEGKDERGIIKALILGDETEVLPHVSASYAGTGTLHVLSVSGLHVGIIFGVLSFLLKFLTRSTFGRILNIIILLFCLWLYALLTGFSPSVARSAAMFSFVVIGLNIRRLTNIYNSLAVSALVLLFLDPYLIMQVGFQLSYLAVMGIVWLQPKINVLWQPEAKWKAWMWQALAVSFAAQMATFPLGLYYFNQFPLYFLPANLAVIPLSSLILIIGCVFSVLSTAGFLQPLLWFLGKLLYYMVLALNSIVDFIYKIPLSTLNGIYITVTECIVLYLVIIFIIIGFSYRNKNWLMLSLISLVCIFILRTADKIYTSTQNQLIVHAIPKTNVLSFYNGKELFTIGDSAFVFNADKLKFNLHRYAFSRYVNAKDIKPVSQFASVNENNFYFRFPLGQIASKKFIWLKNMKHFFGTAIYGK